VEGRRREDTRERCSLEASMAKLAASEAAHRAAGSRHAGAGLGRLPARVEEWSACSATCAPPRFTRAPLEVQRMIIAANILAG
jgi:hypothetical protein